MEDDGSIESNHQETGVFSMTISVVINTYNRGEHLRRCLMSLARQTYDDFEVIVVNGPSTDNTDQVLEEFKNCVKVESCPIVNLSVSRNIGIRVAAGDIVAFIDDDAVPGNPDWLQLLADSYDEEKIGGVGGTVYWFRDDAPPQFKDGFVDAWGVACQNNQHDETEKHEHVFRYLQGCNCSFRRKALVGVGGFDEFYEYYLDESDVAVRMQKAGWSLKFIPEASVYHEMAKSNNRRETQGDKWYRGMNWYPIIKNQVYFALKNTEDLSCSVSERKKNAIDAVKSRLQEFQDAQSRGELTKKEYDDLCKIWKKAVTAGENAGLNENRKLLHEPQPGKFKVFPKEKIHKQRYLNIVLLCESFDIDHPDNGVASYTAQLAKAYRRLGHQVHVIVPWEGQESFDLYDGVNIHRITVRDEDLQLSGLSGLPRHLFAISKSCADRVGRIRETFGADVIESPLWDSMGLMTSYMYDIPFLVRLQTPLKEVVDTFHWKMTDELTFAMDMERKMMMQADGIITISKDIKKTIEQLYRLKFKQPVKLNYLGIPTDAADDESLSSASDSEPQKILFLGRLERRKGIQHLLTVIPRILKKYPNTEFRIAGDDTIVDAVLQKTFKQQFLDTAPKEARKNVHFLGKVSEKEKEEELQSCDLFVAPSLYESFGIVFLEAMRRGKPVIGCKAGGMQEIIKDGSVGYLAKPDDDETLYQCIDKMLGDTKMRIQMGKAAKQWVKTNFDPLQKAQESIDFYHSFVEDRDRYHG